MLKFYIVEEDGKASILKFESLYQWHKWERKHYIKTIQTLDVDTSYAWHLDGGVTVTG